MSLCGLAIYYIITYDPCSTVTLGYLFSLMPRLNLLGKSCLLPKKMVEFKKTVYFYHAPSLRLFDFPPTLMYSTLARFLLKP